jgi:hypothetical protein
MSNIHLVTGYAGLEHVTSADQGAFNASIFGNGQFVLSRGNKLAASVITNNLIRVLDGDILMQGRHIRLNEGTYVDLTIESGVGGYLRNDLIVVRYTKNGTTGVEECNLVVIKGENAVDNPVDPSYTSGDIVAGNALLNDMPLYRVPLNGLNVGELVPMFTAKETDLADEKQDKTNRLATGSDIADNDYIPLYDTSVSGHRKVLWSRIKAVLGAVFAPLTHSHAITDVTNLQGALNGKAASEHSHNAADIASGTLSLDRFPIVPLEKGGTGATTAAAALIALGGTRCVVGAYSGDGADSRTISLGFTPKFVMVARGGSQFHSHDNRQTYGAFAVQGYTGNIYGLTAVRIVDGGFTVYNNQSSTNSGYNESVWVNSKSNLTSYNYIALV